MLHKARVILALSRRRFAPVRLQQSSVLGTIRRYVARVLRTGFGASRIAAQRRLLSVGVVPSNRTAIRPCARVGGLGTVAISSLKTLRSGRGWRTARPPNQFISNSNTRSRSTPSNLEPREGHPPLDKGACLYASATVQQRGTRYPTNCGLPEPASSGRGAQQAC